ncbi:hypothetical protein [Psychrobacter aestuarii]|uniref:Sulfurtransferase complex subunit TusB n=1 Tax=Psychrobacter aestuarii TaxID=556327 RepID=A0ABN0VPI4_9GAMM|nr:hypothetical protein [Psychrobacter aestuarii]
MATLYQLHTTGAALNDSVAHMASTWQAGDSILLLDASAAYIDWLQMSMNEHDLADCHAFYALEQDINALDAQTLERLKLHDKLTQTLSDSAWVDLTQDAQFQQIISIAL